MAPPTTATAAPTDEPATAPAAFQPSNTIPAPAPRREAVSATPIRPRKRNELVPARDPFTTMETSDNTIADPTTIRLATPSN